MQQLSFDNISYLAGERRLFLISGEVHYFRVPHEQWRDRLQKMKDAGGNCVATYVPWLIHEPEEGTFDFENPQYDIERFLEICNEVGLWAIVRPGPYQYSELAYDGLPGWLCENYSQLLAHNVHGEPFRKSSISYLHPLFLEKARRWYDEIIPRLARHQVTEGGAVAMAQFDNELMGIHRWSGSLDFNAETMGVGRETGRWPDFLQKRYDGLEAVNAAYGISAENWAEVLPLNQAEQGTPQELRRVKDYVDCYQESIAEYAELLTNWMRERGMTVPVVHNSPNPTENADFRRMVQRLGDDFLLGSDHYYALDMDWDARNPEIKYAAKCFYSLEQLRLFGVPPTIFELPGGSLSDFPPITAHDADCAYLLNIGYGMKGYNYYIFTGGYNPPGVGTTSEIYDYGAAVGPDGEIRRLYEPQQRLGKFLQQNGWLAGAERIADCQVGMVWEYSQGSHYKGGAIDGAFSHNAAWTFFWKGVLMTSFCASRSPRLTDLSSDDLLEQTNLPLIVAAGSSLARSIQERLVEFLKRGGKLLLAPVVPVLDEHLQPCTILADYLGGVQQEAYKPMAPLLTAFDVPNVFVNGGLFASDKRPDGAETIATEKRGDREIGWKLEMPSGGRVIVLGFHWKQAKREHEAVLKQALAALDCSPVVECSNPNVWTSLRSDGERTMLFLLNPFTAPMQTGIRFYDHGSDTWKEAGNHKLPGISVRVLQDGDIIYQTGEDCC